MQWEVIAAIGQWAGTIAVVATVFYLARQIRQQNVNTGILMQDSIIGSFDEAMRLLAGSKELSSLFARGLTNPDALDHQEATQVQWMLRLFNNTYLKIYKLHQQGELSDEDWQAHSAHAASMFNTPGGRLFWESNKHTYPAFREAILRANPLPLDTWLGAFSLGRDWRAP